jgi:hypothetical protein
MFGLNVVFTIQGIRRARSGPGTPQSIERLDRHAAPQAPQNGPGLYVAIGSLATSSRSIVQFVEPDEEDVRRNVAAVALFPHLVAGVSADGAGENDG